MPATSLIDKLNAQIKREFYASHLCLNLSSWCVQHKLIGSANFLRSLAQNNVTHMMRVFNFMKQSGGAPNVETVSPPKCECRGLEELFQKMLEEYQLRHKSLLDLKEEALAANADHVVKFLMVLDKEQTRDAKLLHFILEEVRGAKRSGMCMSQADRRVLELIEHEYF